MLKTTANETNLSNASISRPVGTTQMFQRVNFSDGERCETGQCPGVYTVKGSTDLIVQGFSVGAEKSELQIPGTEDVVRIPRYLAEQIAKALSEGKL